ARRRGPPVAQRAVSIGGTAVNQPGSLSERARLVLRLIDGGTEWLTWAASHPSVRYDFVEEPQLVTAVQMGIHASPLALLPETGLWVGPTKLMALRASDLRTLVRAEGGDKSAVCQAQTDQVLDENGLLDQTKLAKVDNFLKDCNVAD